jgi:hypothetical protein
MILALVNAERPTLDQHHVAELMIDVTVAPVALQNDCHAAGDFCKVMR